MEDDNNSDDMAAPEKTVSVILDDLELAFMWTSSDSPGTNSAFISWETGQIYSTSHSHDVDEETPEDIDDASLYLRVPDKRDLDMGIALIFKFVDEHAPKLSNMISDCFSKKGAYRRFKDILERNNLLDKWHKYEEEATLIALKEWAAENGVILER